MELEERIADGLLLVGVVQHTHGPWPATPEDRADVLADGRMGVVEAAYCYRPERGSWRNYAYTIIKGRMRDGARRVMRHNRLDALSLQSPVRDDEGEWQENAIADDDAEDPCALAMEACELVRMERCMKQVPPRLRHVLSLRYWEGLSQAETAAEIGVSESRARQMEAAALKGLRHLLDGEDA